MQNKYFGALPKKILEWPKFFWVQTPDKYTVFLLIVCTYIHWNIQQQQNKFVDDILYLQEKTMNTHQQNVGLDEPWVDFFFFI